MKNNINLFFVNIVIILLKCKPPLLISRDNKSNINKYTTCRSEYPDLYISYPRLVAFAKV